jgi:hypothetical protein
MVWIAILRSMISVTVSGGWPCRLNLASTRSVR